MACQVVSTVLSGAVELPGQGSDIVSRVQSGEGKQELLDETNAAIAGGVFGVPTFKVGNRLFWGQDRLHQVRC